MTTTSPEEIARCIRQDILEPDAQVKYCEQIAASFPVFRDVYKTAAWFIRLAIQREKDTAASKDSF